MTTLTGPIQHDTEVNVTSFYKRMRLHQGAIVLTGIALLCFLIRTVNIDRENLVYFCLLLCIVIPAAISFCFNTRRNNHITVSTTFALSFLALIHVAAAYSLEVFEKQVAPSLVKEPFYYTSLFVIFLAAGTTPWGPSLTFSDPPKSGIFGIASLDEEKEVEDLGEATPLLQTHNVALDRKVIRVKQSSLLSFIFLAWATDLVITANKKPQLLSSDIPMLPMTLRGLTATLRPDSLFYKISAARKPVAADGTPQEPLTSKWLLWLCIHTHWRMLALDFLIRLVSVVVVYVPPFILHALIATFDTVVDDSSGESEQPSNLATRTLLLCAALCASQVLNAILSTHNEYYSEIYLLSVIRAQLAAVLFDKALTQQERVSTELEHTSGKIINLLNADSHALPDALRHFRNIVIPAFRLSLGCVFIYNILGWSGLVAMLLTFVLFPASAALGKWSLRTDRRLSRARDKRVSLLQETIAAIKTIKLNSWESKALDRISSLREAEVKLQRERFWVGTCWNVAWDGIPVLIQLVAFMLYTTVQKQVLTPSTAFVALNVFHICSSALTDIPSSINDIFTGIVSLQRIVTFLNGEDLEALHPVDGKESPLTVATRDATIAWPSFETNLDEFRLSLGTLEFPKAQVSLICGPIGSGKSLLLKGLLGETHVISGAIHAPQTATDALPLPEDVRHIRDSEWLQPGMGYVPQTAYLRHASIRDNILFGLPYNAKRYYDCMKACALLPDMALLPEGDQTEVGERGVTLSGGQKARLSLARAVYGRTCVLLIDDVLSAVDAHTTSHIVTHCLRGPLMADRTVIMATHSVDMCLPIARYVVELDDGKVVFQGAAINYAAETTARSPTSFRKLPSSQDTPQVPFSEPRSPAIIQALQVQKSTKLVEVEHRAIGRVEWKSYRYMLGSAGGLLYWILFATVFVGTQSLYLAESAWVREWTSAIGTPKGSQLGYYLGIYALLIWLGIFADASRWIWLYQGFTNVGAKVIHRKALKALLGQPLRFFDTTPQGRILARFGNDMTRLDGHFPDDIGRTILYGLEILTPAAIILTIAPAFGVVVLCSVPFFLIFYAFYIKGSRDIRRIEMVASAPVMTFFAECATLSGAASVIRSFGACNLMMITMMRVRDIERVNGYASWATKLWAFLITNIANAFIASATGVLLVRKRADISAAQAGFTLLLANTISSAVLATLQRAVELELTMISGQRMYDIPAGWPFTGRLDIMGLRAGYAPGLPNVLHDITLQVESGTRVGVVGATGCGKSTLVSSLFRLIDLRSGRILIDGVDISTIRLSDLRSRLTIVPQDPVLMSGTLRSTLDYDGEHEDAAIFHALRTVHLLADESEVESHSSVASEEGAAAPSVFANLDTVVASGGANFSLGQRQLLVLAQSMLKQSKILVLDEATASIDHKTDAKITETIRNQFQGATLLVVAHRLKTIIDFDKIIVMDAGRVVEFDSPASLLKDSNSRFFALCKATGSQQFETLQRTAFAT